MSSSLVRGKYIICNVGSRTDVQIIHDGAVFQRDGTIVEIGRHQELAAKYQPDEIIGSPDHLVLPGFVNSHHHIGLTPLQKGAPDAALELWFAHRMGARDVDLYLDTLYSAFEMIESGVTTVQHLHGFRSGPLDRLIPQVERILKAYEDIGMRASYSFSVVDQNRLVYNADENFIRSLPEDIALGISEYVRARSLPVQECFTLFEELWARYSASERIRVQLAPANLHWCSDEALLKTEEYSSRYGVGMHMNLLETPYQMEYASRRTGTTAVRHLHNLGLLGPRLTLGHAVWMNDDDIGLVADSGTMVCHNASSNLRLRSGMLPLTRFLDKGVRVGLGLDEAGINDDRDMLQELRLVLRMHQGLGMGADGPTPAEIFRMATEHGASTTPFGARLGTLEPGKAADIVLVDWRAVSYPYLDDEVPVIDALVQRAKPSAIDTVIVAGEPILRGGRFTRVDKTEVLEELAASLRGPLRPEELRRRSLAREVFPYYRRFYDAYLEGGIDRPSC